MENVKDYSTYLFDVGGTLITFDEWLRAQRYVERAARSNLELGHEDMYSILSALNLELPDRSRGVPLSLLSEEEQRAFWVDFWAEGFRRMGVGEDDAVVFADEILDAVNGGDLQKVFEDAVPALETLKARGKQMGIISNFSPNCETLLEALGLAQYFDFFIVSGIVGIEKPDPRIFELAVKAAGKDVRDLVYVGDSIFHDVEGARGAGMDAVLIDRTGRYPNFEREFGKWRVHDLREL